MARSVGLGDRPSSSELVVLAAGGTSRFLALAVRRWQPLTAVLLLIVVAALGYGMLWGWWLVPVLLASAYLLCWVTFMVTLLLARSAVGGRVLLVERGPTGWAFMTASPGTDRTREVWRPRNLISRPSKSGRILGRAQRPGAVLVRRAVLIAHERDLDILVVSATKAVAEKVYLPAGLVYEQGPVGCHPLLRPRLRLPVKVDVDAVSGHCPAAPYRGHTYPQP